MLDKDLVDSFCLEIIANSIKIIKDIKKISTHEFSSDSSKDVLLVINNIAESIIISTKSLNKGIDWEDRKLISSRIRQLKRLKELIQMFSSHLQYIENSKMDKIPWGLIEPFQNIASSITPNARIILCQQWNYNYSIITTNLFDYYLSQIELLEEFISEESFNQLQENLNNPLYLISFPYLEKNNILLYSLLGHEVGHLVADKFINKFRPNTLNDIKHTLMDQYNKQFKDITSIATYIKRCQEIWERLFVELLSDVVGGLLFGPAMLFSMFEFSMQFDMDTLPEKKTQFYPPWRTRLRLILSTISRFIPSLNNIKSDIFTEHDLKKRLLQIKEIVDDNEDINQINSNDILVKLIYADVLEKIESNIPYLLKLFNKDNFNEENFFNNINVLNTRLQNGIPPNIIDELNLDTVSSIEEIINAAWKYRLSWEAKIFDDNGNFNEKYIEIRKNLNKLTIKAIEYTNLMNNYKNYNHMKRL